VQSLASEACTREVGDQSQAGVIPLLNTITHATAAGENTDQLAAEGIYTLLDARRVVIRRGHPDNEVVVADVGEPEAPLDLDGFTQLDAEGHVLDARPPGGRWCGGCDPPRGPSSSWSGTASRLAASS
jgi:hypothetical protein